MTIHSFHIFDRRGKTLFTKTYSPMANQQQLKMIQQQQQQQHQQQSTHSSSSVSNTIHDINPINEQRKLIFGMLFSLKELMNQLAPTTTTTNSSFSDNNNVVESSSSSSFLHSVKTGACTIHYYETIHGLRFVLYTSNDIPYSNSPTTTNTTTTTTTTIQSSSSSITTTTAAAVMATSISNSKVLSSSSILSSTEGNNVLNVLRYIYVELYVNFVIHCPTYKPGMTCISSTTTFEKKLDTFLSSLSWFR